MKYSKEEALREVRRREADYRDKRFRMEMPILSVSSVLLLSMVIGMLDLYHDALGDNVMTSQNYGTILINAGIGGYVLVAVVAFMAGVVSTVLCVRYRKRKRRPAR